ncbi:MAG: DNA polymerase I [Gammaproteobacteria bacterium]|nr:DNA polymerase I [Gammaproteobacteria bacterium]
MIEKKQPLVLVDGSSYLYRAFHAMPDLTNSKGDATGAVYGVVNMLKRLLKDHQSHHVGIIFDAKGKTFRDELFPEYKANRASMPDDLRSQIEILHEVIKALGFPLIAIPGVEADDVIGTLALKAEHMGIDTIVSTGDKDLAQLVSKHVTLIDTMKNQTMDYQGVIEKFGVKPEQIRDYLALVGDTADNIPGVMKCGPKTAVKWLTEYPSVEQIIENADRIKGKVGENLREGIEQLKLSYELVTIKCDVEIDTKVDLETTINDLKMQEQDVEKLKQLYSQLEFKTWLKQLVEDEQIIDGEQGDLFAAPVQDDIETDYQIILQQEQFEQWLERLKKSELFSFDLETTALEYMQAEIVGLSFAINVGEAAYVPFIHDDIAYSNQLSRDDCLSKLKPILEDPKQSKVGQNLKYDKNVLANYDIDLAGIAFDTMLESYVLDSTASRHNMDALAKKYLNYETTHFEDVAGKGAKQLRFDQVPVEQAANYACEDADITLRLHQFFWPKLSDKKDLVQLFQQIELPLSSVLSRIERNGVLIDQSMLQQQSAELSKSLIQIQAQAFELAGEEFNLSSPKQIQQILYEKMQLPVKSKTPKGAPSTSESALQELALDHPLPKLILSYRSLAKLKTTYTDKLPLLIDNKTGRVHTSYNQAVAVTGRLSSTDPNLQNIPIRTDEGRKIRRAFIASDNKLIVAADYSQIELRIMAHLSADKGLLSAFEQGVDVHKATAAEVFAVPLDMVSQNQRRSAKAINFGLIYGMSAFGLAKQLDIGRKEAQDYVNLYFDRYPGVKEYMDSMAEYARDKGYVETILGRRLYLADINAKNAQRRKYAERTAINAPMQGSAADIIKKAMLSVDSWLNSQEKSDSEDIKMIMQVHDELVFEVPVQQLDSATQQIKQLMESAATLKVPLIVDVGQGKNWDEAH